MKKFLLALCVCLAAVTLVTSAFAEEIWDFHLRGHTEGLALGDIPPPGFYFINEIYVAPGFKLYDAQSHANSNVKLFAYIDIPILLWVPGCKFLGADYAAGIEEPFDYTNLRIQTVHGSSATGKLNTFQGGSQWGAYNTVLLPGMLSWKLPYDFHVMAGFEVGLNDGSTSPGNRVRGFDPVTGQKFAYRYQPDGGIYAESSNDTYVFAPLAAVSWLHGPWNFTIFMEYDISTKDTDTNYQSADEFAADYTLTYTWNKWTFGIGAAQENQVGSDKFVVPTSMGGDGLYHSQPGTKVSNYSMGPLLGYNFGPCSVMFMYNWALSTTNDVGGQWFNFRLVVPLGNPFPVGGK